MLLVITSFVACVMLVPSILGGHAIRVSDDDAVPTLQSHIFRPMDHPVASYLQGFHWTPVYDDGFLAP